METLYTSSVFILIILTANVVLSIWLEEHTKLKHLGAALLVILITAVVANLGLIPSASDNSPVYGGIFKYVAPISIFYLLLEVNLNQLKKAGWPMLILFFVGAIGTVSGVLASHFLFGDYFGENAAPIAGMITGTYVGGSINFNAVAIHYNMMEQGTLYAAIIAVDNILTTVWMVVTLTLPKILNRIAPQEKKISDSTNSNEEYQNSHLNIYSLAVLITLGFAAYLLADVLSTVFFDFGVQIPSILILTTIALILAQFPWINQLKEAKIIGLYLIYLFLAVIGAFCELEALSTIGEVALYIFGYLSIAVIVHGVLIFLIGRVFKFDWEMVSVASQANVGGSSSALALAKSLMRSDLLLASVLVGSLGNGIGTYVGFLLAGLL